VTDRSDDSWRPSLGLRMPAWLGREAVSFLLAATWVVYSQALVITVLMVRGGRFEPLEEVAVVAGFVGAAPLVGAALRAHVERSGGRRTGRLWDIGRRRTPVDSGTLAVRRRRVTDLAVGVGSLAAFWALFTGSLVAAAVVPVVIWWAVLDRGRWVEQPG
jgi:hypothetical protein